jgi:hypothetical protein
MTLNATGKFFELMLLIILLAGSIALLEIIRCSLM